MPNSMFLKLSLLLGLLALGPHVCSWKFEDISKSTPNFRLCVEFAVFHFNEHEPDEYAYKLLWVGRSQRKMALASLKGPHFLTGWPSSGLRRSPGPVEAEGPSNITADSAATPALP
ncbi:hypothetical protein J1605_003154 [Eschrichtius robustus]|uniref:Cystatin-15 n=1 Tax=Eschrichtius robustus TaxID=9764 RepID=A0AB34HNF7_ESCRO|nr:hypothetical protein J1605_003154 [Eschrichtius robustus]